MSVKTCQRDNKLPTTLSPTEQAILQSLFTTHYKALLRSAQRFLHDRTASHDIVMDLLLHVSQRPSLALKAIDLPYLVAAIGNRSINYLRKTQKENMRLISMFEYEYQAFIPPPDSALVEKELKSQIMHAMKTVPLRARTIFYLHRRFNMTYQEIALQKKVSIRTVESQMSMALRCLRNAVLPERF